LELVDVVDLGARLGYHIADGDKGESP